MSPASPGGDDTPTLAPYPHGVAGPQPGGDGRDGVLRPGSALGGFVIEQWIGSGGMGVVYRACDPGCGRTVALKVMREECAHDPQARALFVREALLATAVEHPHIVPVYAAGNDGKRLYLAMRYVPGSDLATLTIRTGGLPPRRALGILSNVAQALGAAHRRGVLHGDIKPSNILVGEGGDDEVYLSDFGVSSFTGASRVLGGTPRYQAPEVASGERPTERSDVYSLASTLYETLTSMPPGSSTARRGGRLRRNGSSPDLAPALRAILESGMAQDPAHRPPSPRALIAAAEEAAADAGPGS